MNTVKYRSTVNRHFVLNSGAVLTLSVEVNKIYQSVKYGWALYNPEDADQWSRKTGNKIARSRLAYDYQEFLLGEHEEVTNTWINFRVVQHFFNNIISHDPNIPPLSVQRMSDIYNYQEKLLIEYLEKNM